MSSSLYVVTVIVDPDFGDRLAALPPGAPAWIADTPANRSAAQRCWAEAPAAGQAEGVTTFRVEDGALPSAWCEAILPEVDLHHGAYSHTPPYAALDVLGADATPELRAALAAFGLTHLEPITGGFRASHAMPSA